MRTSTSIFATDLLLHFLRATAGRPKHRLHNEVHGRKDHSLRASIRRALQNGKAAGGAENKRAAGRRFRQPFVLGEKADVNLRKARGIAATSPRAKREFGIAPVNR